MPLPSTALIRELGPREGFQILKQVVPTDKKLELIRLLNSTGVKEMEIASFVRADRVPQMADAECVVARYERRAGVHYSGVYLNTKGFERAEATRRLDNRAWLYTAASDSFLKDNSNTSRREMIAAIPHWLAAFSAAGKMLHGVMISTAFGCSHEGTISAERVVEVLAEIAAAADSGGQPIHEISLADTVGWGTPEKVRRCIGAVRTRFPALTVSLHLHDTRGSGLASAYAGLLEGVQIFEASVGGMGGCPFAPGASGNIVTEDLVYMLEDAGVATGISLDRYIEAACFAEEITGTRLPSKMLRARLCGV